MELRHPPESRYDREIYLAGRFHSAQSHLEGLARGGAFCVNPAESLPDL